MQAGWNASLPGNKKMTNYINIIIASTLNAKIIIIKKNNIIINKLFGKHISPLTGACCRKKKIWHAYPML